MNWVRITRNRRCPVCNKDSWCLLSPDGSSAICMRVASDQPHEFKDGSLGWIHRLNGQPIAIPQKIELPSEPSVDVDSLISKWAKQTTAWMLQQLSKMLGVAPSSLVALEACYSPDKRAWAFPMRQPNGQIVGARLRLENGRKISIKGGHEGLFVPSVPNDGTALICEGPTDTAAALTLGYFAIGRPSCAGGLVQCVALLKRLHIRRVVIVADNDKPGIDGAKRLADALEVRQCILLLPCKDLRAFVQLGGTADDLEEMIAEQVWRSGSEQRKET